MQQSLMQKLVTEVQHYRNKEFLKAAMAVCALAALADNEFKLSERYRIFQAFAAVPALKELDLNKAIEILDDYIHALRKDEDRARDVLYHKVRRMAAHPKRARTMMRVAYLIIVADDEVTDSELREFRRLCVQLDLLPDQVWQELAGARSVGTFSAKPTSPASSGEVLSDETLAPGQSWSRVLTAGQVLRVIDIEGHQGVDFLCYNADNPDERYHAPNTLKAAGTLKLSTGHRLYSDEARAIFTITADSYGGHDTIAGCCSAPSNRLLYGVSDCPGCRENFLTALAPHGLGRRDIVPNINFFCAVPVHDHGALADGVFVKGSLRPGAHVDLRAEINALAVISNCPQVNNPCNAGHPTAIRLVVSQPLQGTRAPAES